MKYILGLVLGMAATCTWAAENPDLDSLKHDRFLLTGGAEKSAKPSACYFGNFEVFDVSIDAESGRKVFRTSGHGSLAYNGNFVPNLGARSEVTWTKSDPDQLIQEGTKVTAICHAGRRIEQNLFVEMIVFAE